MKIGYARVSTTGQSLETQIKKLEQAGCNKIFKEKITGTNKRDREQLKQALEYVREGDSLYITKLDRLARSLKDLTNITETLQKQKIGFIVLDQDINTTTPTGKLLFHLLGAIGEFERDLIVERTTEGRSEAKARGVKFGRKPALTEKQKKQLKADFSANTMSKADIAKNYGVGRSTVYRVGAE